MRATGERDRSVRAAAAAATFAALALAVAATPAAAGSNPHYIGATIGNPETLPDFALHDQNGRLVSLRSQRGKVVLLTFLYTECRDVCPLVAANLNAALRQLGAERKNVRVLAISVDPVGDTGKAVRQFVSSHRLVPEFHYLRGTDAQLQPVWQAYDVTSIRHAKADVDHTLYTVLADRAGKGRVLYDATALPGEIAHDLRLFLN